MRVFGESAGLLWQAGADPEWLAAIEAEIGAEGDVPPAPVPTSMCISGATGTVTRSRRMICWMTWRAGRSTEPWSSRSTIPARRRLRRRQSREVAAAAAAAPDSTRPVLPGRPAPGCARGDRGAAVAGARGLKLHPVAQGFAPGVAGGDRLRRRGDRARLAGADPRRVRRPAASPTLSRAARCRAGVRGSCSPTAPAAMRGRCARGVADHPGVWFDTSLAALPDLVGLPPASLLFGSDRPYGDYATALQLVGLAAVSRGGPRAICRGARRQLSRHFWGSTIAR